jgi:8-oxo-dGTP pyrophosphatase MutT (NUDIX family)
MEEPIEELSSGPPTEPRPAASVILLRDSERAVEVLLVKRSARARFMADVWVFPGGAVDAAPKATEEPGEEDIDDAYRATALRELEEEVSIALPSADTLVPFSRWITPVEVKIRFDTRFYVVRAPDLCDPRPDGEEIVDSAWLSPQEALARRSADELLLVFPTVKHLEALSGFDSVEEALTAARSCRIEPILPRVVHGDGEPRILLPGDAGYERA